MLDARRSPPCGVHGQVTVPFSIVLGTAESGDFVPGTAVTGQIGFNETIAVQQIVVPVLQGNVPELAE